jgi:hypothetical protein
MQAGKASGHGVYQVVEEEEEGLHGVFKQLRRNKW